MEDDLQKIRNDFQKSFELLYLSTINFRKHLYSDKIYNNLSQEHYIKEFCILKFKGCRQMITKNSIK
jgi:hypothetical protein